MKKLLLSFALLCLFFVAHTQIESSIYPPDGTVLSLTSCEKTDPLANITGENVTWDYSEILECDDEWSVSFHNAAGSPESFRFPEANKYYEIIVGQDTILIYNKLEDSKLEAIGLKHGSFNPPFYLHYTVGESILNFPAELNDTWTNNYTYVTELDTISSTSTYVVDGIGTLILPNATYENVFRVYSTRPMSAGFFTEETYTYYSPEYQFHLLHMLVDDETQYQANPKNVMTSTKELTDSKIVNISPNPTSNINNLNIQLDTDNEVDIYLISRLGEIIISKKGIKFSEGYYNFNSNRVLPKGMYFIQIVEDNKVYTSKVNIM